MPSVGDTLREAREGKGISLSRAASATKIQERLLVALEQGDLGSLPNPVFTKGLLHNYAEYLGLDGEDIVKMAGLGTSNLRYEKITVQPEAHPMEHSARFAPSFTIILFAVVIAAALFAWSYSAFFVAGSGTPTPLAMAPSPTPTASSLSSATPSAAATQVAGTTGAKTPVPTTTTTATPTPSPTPEVYTEIELKIAALQPAWVLIRADGKQIANATLPAQSVTTYTATGTISLWCGNSDYIEVTINGQKIGRLGGAGEDIVKTAWTLQNGKVVTAQY
jgi:cytoskeletal protein RodZ